MYMVHATCLINQYYKLPDSQNNYSMASDGFLQTAQTWANAGFVLL